MSDGHNHGDNTHGGHSHSHADHAHDGHGHSHSHTISDQADRRLLWAALIVIVTFMALEVAVAYAANSLALLSDAGHMLSDAAAIAIAIWITHIAARPASGKWTFGLRRAEVLSGLANGATMLVVAVIIVFEAFRRLVAGGDVSGWPVVITALVGIVVNLIATWLLARANRQSLNIRGAYQHILTDLYAFIGTAIAGLVIVFTGWVYADILASLLVAGLMITAGWVLVRDSGFVLLEAAPEGISLEEMEEHLLGQEHVLAVHDLHVWQVGSSEPMVSAHLVIDDECFERAESHEILDNVQACFAEHFNVSHSTFQFEREAHGEHEATMH